VTSIMSTTVVASASVYVAGEHMSQTAVQGVAVGVPVIRQPSKRAATASSHTAAPSVSSTSGAVLAESFLYSALSAKLFARFDIDSSGAIDQEELRLALRQLGLSDTDLTASMARFDVNQDGLIQLSEWEAGLDARTRAAIEALVDAETASSTPGMPLWLHACIPCMTAFRL
jgi:hypothetical protein